MPFKVSKKVFIETIENNENSVGEKATDEELASQLQISKQYFFVLKHRWRMQIRDYAVEMARKAAMTQIGNLKRNAKNGDTKAAAILLEIAETYIPQKKQKIDLTGQLQCGVIVVPEKKLEGALVNLIEEKSDEQK